MSIEDVVELGAAVSSGEGVVMPVANVAIDVVGVASPVPGISEVAHAIEGVAKVAEVAEKTEKVAAAVEHTAAEAAESAGRAGKQARLRELADDPKVGSADRGWLKNEKRQVAQGNRDTIRTPPGKDLAHERGREAARGFSDKHSNLQNRAQHRMQHKFDNFGRKNKKRSLPSAEDPL
jgi:Bacterial toxin 8